MQEGDSPLLYDRSTINQKVLKRFPVYVKPSTYRIDTDHHMGAGGHAGDPPGYPTWFARCVYTQYGNYPQGRNTLVMEDDQGVLRLVWRDSDNAHFVSWDDEMIKRAGVFRKLWLPLSWDSLRFALWETSQYVHYRNCYYSPEPDKQGSHVFIASDATDTKTSYNHKVNSGAFAGKSDLELIVELQRAARLVRPDNSYAVHAIQEFYPDYKVNRALLNTAWTPSIVWAGIRVPVLTNNRWWERCSVPQGLYYAYTLGSGRVTSELSQEYVQACLELTDMLKQADLFDQVGSVVSDVATV